MIIGLPVILKDLSLARDNPQIIGITIQGVEAPEFFDGPATRRVAVVDLDERTGRLRRPVKLVPPTVEGMPPRYDLPRILTHSFSSERTLRRAEDLVKISAFATALMTLNFFERKLGREITWAFPSRQLLIVPRAGTLENAFYERESGSLQFYSFTNRHKREIHTALSSDIVAHETTHAILDGILPDLYDAHTPQSLAIHETIADLVAAALFLTDEGALYFLGGMGPTFKTMRLGLVAEEFGSAISQGKGEAEEKREKPRKAHEEQRDHRPRSRADHEEREQHRALRSLINRRTLKPNDRTRAKDGSPNRVSATDPHELSTVLSGAIFAAYQREGRRLLERNRPRQGEPAERELQAYREASRFFVRTVVGPLQLLPPGELSFADFAQAVSLGSELDETGRQWLRKEFLRRGIEPNAALECPRGRRISGLTRARLDLLLKSSAAARAFVKEHRTLFHIPNQTRFEVLPPRVIIEPATGSDFTPYRVVLRVRWSENERYDLPKGCPPLWLITRGSTIVVDYTTCRVEAVLTSGQREGQRAERQSYLRQLANDGILVSPRRALRPDGRIRADVLVPERVGAAVKLTGSGRTLHLMGSR